MWDSPLLEFTAEGQRYSRGDRFEHPQAPGDLAVGLAAVFLVAGALEEETHVGGVDFQVSSVPAEQFAVADVGRPLRRPASRCARPAKGFSRRSASPCHGPSSRSAR